MVILTGLMKSFFGRIFFWGGATMTFCMAFFGKLFLVVLFLSLDKSSPLWQKNTLKACFFFCLYSFCIMCYW